MKNILKKIICIMFILFIILLLYVLLFRTNSNYILKREEVNINKILVIAIDLLFAFLFVKLINNNNVSNKKYYYVISVFQILLFIIQIIILFSIKFNTGWDVELVKNTVDTFIKNGSLMNNEYLSIYPNNILLVGILSLITKLPIIGKCYMTTLLFNTILVNLSILFISLSIKNYHSNKLGIIIYMFVIPLIAFNPWFIVPYSDVYALFFISIINYIYSRHNKNNRDIFLLVFLSIFGYFIKPTIILPLFCMIINEVINSQKIISSKNNKRCVSIVLGIIMALLIKNCFIQWLNFQSRKDIYPMTIFHYLAMGQNTSTAGFYNEIDETNSKNNGYKYDIDVFKDRFVSNIGRPHFNLIINKMVISFGDGSYLWGYYGNFFPKNILEKSNKYNLFQEIYYINGKYYNYYLNIINIIWYCLLLFLPFVLLNGINKNEQYLIMCILSMTIFLLVFEPNSRYIYSYSGIFISLSLMGLYKIYDLLKF